jgi:hypothetical protein
VRPDLSSAQTALLSFITGAGGTAPSGLVLGDERASADERLQVYAHMYQARLVEALDSIYPRLAGHLGHDAFEEVARGYVADHPSRNPSLRFLGTELPEWLEQRRPEAPWLADLARLEWARSDVFDAPDEQGLTLDALRGLPPDDFATLPLRLIGAHRLVTVDHATAELWDGAATDEPIDPTRESDDPQGETILVWRQDTAVYHRRLAADEAAAVERVAAGTTFGAICEALVSKLSPEEATARAFGWLSTWASDGLLAD